MGSAYVGVGRSVLAWALLAALTAGMLVGGAAEAAPVAISGLTLPTAVEFGPNGRVFVAEKAGIVKTYTDLAGGGGRTVLDIRSRVSSFGDFGLLSIAYRDGFLYGAYSVDSGFGDICEDHGQGGRPLPEIKGCPSAGQISRWSVTADGSLGAEQPLIGGFDRYCTQFTSHTIGNIEVGPDGALYISAGEGASFLAADEGQFGANPCSDAPRSGGAFRSQTNADLDGKIVRYDPGTTTLRVVAKGLRNPFRTAFLGPQLYTSDTGWFRWEEINRVDTAAVSNFGWPCYEGASPQPEYQALGNPICGALPAGQVTPPLFAYPHDASGTASISAIEGFEGWLYYGDYSLGTLRRVAPNGTGDTLIATDVRPVDLRRTPDGGLAMVDIARGTIELVVVPGTPPPPPPPGAPSADIRITAVPYAPGASVPFSVVTDIRTPAAYEWAAVLLTGCATPGPSCTRRPLAVTGQGLDRGTFTGPADAAPAFVELTVEVTNAVGAVGRDTTVIARRANGSAPTVTRIQGLDRIETAIKASQVGHPSGAPVAYVARADAFPDALAAGPLAAASGGPILLTPSTSLDARTAAELNRLRPGRVVVLGGPVAVSDGVLATLRGQHPVVERIEGVDRYETAAKTARLLAPVARVYVATGEAFPDALISGVAAGLTDGAVLLTAGTSLPDSVAAALRDLRPAQITIVGGESAVSAGVAAQLAAFGPTQRISGPSRYDTAVAVSRAVFGGTAPRAYVATGEAFPDALSIAPLAINGGAALVLTAAADLPLGVQGELARLAPSVVTIAGGTAAVSPRVESILRWQEP